MKGPAVYKIAYNLSQTIGWAYVFSSVLSVHVRHDGPEQVWDEVGHVMLFCLHGALLEIVHAMIGLVPAPVGTTAIQVLVRLIVGYFCWFIPECRETFIFTLLMISWSSIEVVRYPYYITVQLGVRLKVLKWLRYTLFIFLYPMGIFSEMAVLYLSIPALQRDGVLGVSDFTVVGKLTFYALLIYVLLLLYLPGFPVMFGHMLRQRRRALSPSRNKDGKNTTHKNSSKQNKKA